jgi:hypothetical protein
MFAPLRQNDPDYFVFDWSALLVSEHTPGKHYSLGALVRPRAPTGFLYECTTKGQTQWRPPVWPRTEGATVTDGSAVWTCRTLATATLASVSTVVYTITPTGISQSDDSILADELSSRVRLDASAAGLGVYEIAALMTDSGGEEYEIRTELEVIE